MAYSQLAGALFNNNTGLGVNQDALDSLQAQIDAHTGILTDDVILRDGTLSMLDNLSIGNNNITSCNSLSSSGDLQLIASTATKKIELFAHTQINNYINSVSKLSINSSVNISYNNFDLNSNKIINLANGTASTDGINFGQVLSNSSTLVSGVINSSLQNLGTQNENLDMGTSYKITNLANGTASTDAINFGQVLSNSSTLVSGVINSSLQNLGTQNEALEMGGYNINNCATLTTTTGITNEGVYGSFVYDIQAYYDAQPFPSANTIEVSKSVVACNFTTNQTINTINFSTNWAGTEGRWGSILYLCNNSASGNTLTVNASSTIYLGETISSIVLPLNGKILFIYSATVTKWCLVSTNYDNILSSATSLKNTIVSSSLTSVGTLTSLNMGGNLDMNSNSITDLGAITAVSLTVTATNTITNSVGSLINQCTQSTSGIISNKFGSATGYFTVENTAGSEYLRINNTEIKTSASLNMNNYNISDVNNIWSGNCSTQNLYSNASLYNDITINDPLLFYGLSNSIELQFFTGLVYSGTPDWAIYENSSKHLKIKYQGTEKVSFEPTYMQIQTALFMNDKNIEDIKLVTIGQATSQTTHDLYIDHRSGSGGGTDGAVFIKGFSGGAGGFGNAITMRSVNNTNDLTYIQFQNSSGTEIGKFYRHAAGGYIGSDLVSLGTQQQNLIMGGNSITSLLALDGYPGQDLTITPWTLRSVILRGDKSSNPIRLDATNASGYIAMENNGTEKCLFRKDYIDAKVYLTMNNQNITNVNTFDANVATLDGLHCAYVNTTFSGNTMTISGTTNVFNETSNYTINTITKSGSYVPNTNKNLGDICILIVNNQHGKTITIDGTGGNIATVSGGSHSLPVNEAAIFVFNATQDKWILTARTI